MAEDKGQEKVLIEHADLKEDRTGNPVEVSREAYEKVWKGRGWRLVKGKAGS